MYKLDRRSLVKFAVTAMTTPTLMHSMEARTVQKTAAKAGRNNLTVEPEIEWNEAYGSDTDNWAWTVAESPDDSYFFAGHTAITENRQDGWVVKLSSSGDVIWDRTYGGEEREWIWEAIQTSDGGYLTVGRTSSFTDSETDIWIVKLDTDGNEEWSRTFGGDEPDGANGIIETSDGGYLIAGWTESFSNNGQDVWLLRLTASGEEQWTETYGASEADTVMSILETENGDYLFAGRREWSIEDRTGNAWIGKVNNNGDMIWDQSFGEAGADWATSIIETPDNSYLFAGQSSFAADDQNAWVVKLDTNGNPEWNRTYGGGEQDAAWEVVNTDDGGCLFVGSTESFADAQSDAWIVKLTAAGEEEWTQVFGGDNDDIATAAIRTSDDGYLITGWTQSTSENSLDAWAMKLLPAEDSTELTATFTYSPADPGVDETVRFDASDSTASEGLIEEYQWDITNDDGVDLVGEVVTYAFEEPGDYTISLTVVDSTGKEDSTEQVVSVEEKDASSSSTEGADDSSEEAGRNSDDDGFGSDDTDTLLGDIETPDWALPLAGAAGLGLGAGAYLKFLSSRKEPSEDESRITDMTEDMPSGNEESFDETNKSDKMSDIDENKLSSDTDENHHP